MRILEFITDQNSWMPSISISMGVTMMLGFLKQQENIFKLLVGCRTIFGKCVCISGYYIHAWSQGSFSICMGLGELKLAVRPAQS